MTGKDVRRAFSVALAHLGLWADGCGRLGLSCDVVFSEVVTRALVGERVAVERYLRASVVKVALVVRDHVGAGHVVAVVVGFNPSLLAKNRKVRGAER